MNTKLHISPSHVESVNQLLGSPSTKIVKNLEKVIKKYGTPKEINAKAKNNSALPVILAKLKKINPSYLSDLEWLKTMKDSRSFTIIPKKPGKNPVVLEISSLQYFPWLIAEAKLAIKNKDLMPSRYIRVRNMKEQETDGDLLAVTAAMQILGASVVETLDTRGTDGSNVHLGGPATITGYFGGVGEPNDYVLKWVDEFLYYYTNYGVQEVLNVNPGTILAGYLLYQLGVDIKFKISVFMGNDNPYAGLWTMLGAKLFSRPDGTTPLVGFNWSNSVDNETLELASQVRKQLGFTKDIRFEHHILEAYKSIVRQPYDRRAELLEVVPRVPNISAKHEGGEIKVEKKRAHQSDILDYFIPKSEVIKQGIMEDLLQNYLDKHHAVNLTAQALTKKGLSFLAAPSLHYY